VAVTAVIVALGLGATGATEWVREAIRKPYVIYNYMYSNAILQQDRVRISDSGILQTARWVNPSAVRTPMRAAAEVFRVECRSCHTVDGYNGVRPLLRGWSEPYVDEQLQRLHELKGYMPPFVGSARERRALAHWLVELAGRPAFSAPPAEQSGDTWQEVPR
jgi:mono/diheme cytochrome c family protein